jgi:hypothetical protein
VRDPGEVSTSLVRRDQIATGMDGWRAQRLWWKHNAEVLRQGRGLPLQVVHYSFWFQPVYALKQLQRLVPDQPIEELRAILSSTVKPAHRRSHRQQLPCRLDGAVRRFDRRLQRLAMDPALRTNVLQWLDRQPDLPAFAPLPTLRSSTKRCLRAWACKAASKRVVTHPWGYLAEIVAGSPGPLAEHQLDLWLQHGFQVDELRRFAALPGSRPLAEPWMATEPSIAIQCRASGLEADSMCYWVAQCPINGAASIRAVPFATPHASSVALNMSDVIPGLRGSAELLQLANLERVWDPIPTRVQLLRQLGVKASWLQPRYSDG